MPTSSPPTGEQLQVPPIALGRLAPPRPVAQCVGRSRLLDVLDAGIQGPLTLVTGPPGAGKTVLVSSWVAEGEPPGAVAWLSVEPGDARPRCFWSAVLDAIRVAGEDELASLPLLGETSDLEFVAAFSNVLAERHEPLVLVLDDFEAVRGSQVPEQLDALLRHPPDQLRLVILSRVDPGLSLPRLHLEGRLTELRSADLAFTSEEVVELLRIAGLDLTPENASTLHSRTEGWVAGLRLAVLSLQNHPDPEEFVSSFAGDEHSVADYLVEEVLQRQPAELREFMLRTSVVDLVSAELGDALTGRDDGAELLERLERSNSFLLPLDDHRSWYRYHPMFAELLRSELRHRMPDQFVIQHRRAAHWYAAMGFDLPAIRHALAGKDTGTVRSLLSAHWFALIAHGDANHLIEVLDGLSPELIGTDAELAIAAAAALLDVGDLDGADEHIGLADANAGAVPAKHRADFALARAVVGLLDARLRGRYDDATAAARKVLGGHNGAHLGASSHERRALGLLNLGIAESWSGDERLAGGHIEDALALARQASCDYLALGSLSQLAQLETARGGLRRAASLAREATKLAERRGWDDTPQVAPAHIALASTAYHWGGIGEASEHLEQASRAARLSRERVLQTVIAISQARILLARGELEEAMRAASAARQGAVDWPLPALLAITLAAVEAGALAAAGDAEGAIHTLEAAPNGCRWAELDLVRARLTLADGDPAQALVWLTPERDGGGRPLHFSTKIAVQAHAAVAQHLLGDDAAALVLLEDALALAEPEGYRRPFLTVGAPLRDLLTRRIRAGTAHRALAGDLIDALDPQPGGRREGGALLLDPLSEREEAVLRYLPTALSKGEIASEMFLSVNTVKTHMKNIYRKLDVTNRAEAVRRARSLRLV
jgi:LuxR family transcriptional regulator, maltose regulon positive regulatory protein